MNSAIIEKKDSSLQASIRLPSSKSISNRLLIMEALSGKKFPVKNISDSDDTRLLQRLLETDAELINAQNAGTCFRFLTAYFAQTKREIVLTGPDRMKQRPIRELVDGLRKLGAEITYLE